MTTPRKWIAIALSMGAIALGVALGVLWWNERSLRDIEEHLAKGDAATALSIVDHYLASHSGDSQALALRARALVALGRAPEAASIFDQVGAAGAADLRAWSTALLQLGDWSHALPILERLAQVEPANAETLEAIVACNFELGRQQEAARAATRLAELPGYEAAGQLQLASMYRAWGHATIATQHFQKVLQYRSDATGLDMTPASFFLAYGESLLSSGDARRALEMLDRSAQLNANQTVSLRQGAAWQLIGNYEKAQEILERLAQQYPDNREAHERLAEIALQRNDPTASLRWLQQLLDRDWITANTAYLFRRAYTSLGEESQAQQWQEKEAALRRTERQLAALQTEVLQDPHSPRSRLIAAYQSAASGNWKSAAQSLATLLRQAPDSYAEPFVQQLAEAIRERGKLPPLESIPRTKSL